MATFMSSFTSRDWSPTWLLSSLLKPQIFFLSSQKISSPSNSCVSTINIAEESSNVAAAEAFPSPSSSSHVGDAQAASCCCCSSSSSSSSSSSLGGVVSQQEIVALGRIFDHFDENKDGKISREELQRSLQMFGIETDDAELVSMITSADWNSDGFLDFSEFAAFYYSLNEEMGQKIDPSSRSGSKAENFSNNGRNMNDHRASEEEELRDAFKLFDKDGDGYICAEELQSVLESMGLSQGKLIADCRNMIRACDVDGDGQVSFEEFKQMMVAGFGQC